MIYVLTILAIVLLAGVFSPADAGGRESGLFINLTTDDAWAAAQAIMFAHEKMLKSGHKPVAI